MPDELNKLELIAIARRLDTIADRLRDLQTSLVWLAVLAAFSLIAIVVLLGGPHA